MTKSDYLSNSAKLLLISSALLFLTNALSLLVSFSSGLSEIAEKLSTFSFYGVFVLGFLAFNGEGIAYKHSREIQNKRKTTHFKILILFAFVARFVKAFLENFILKLEPAEMAGVLGRLFLSVFNTVSSYGFLLTMVALWFLVRDNNYKNLVPFEALAFITGLLYNVYKIFNYAVLKYDINVFGGLFSELFSQKTVLNALCLLHFSLDIIMCATAVAFYDKKAAKEQSEKTSGGKKTITARRIYNSDCYGVDFLEDTLFTAKEETQEDIQ